MSVAGGATWARGHGLSLRRLDVRRLDGASLVAADAPLGRALRDGIERGYDGPLPEPPPGTLCFAVRTGGETVGLIAVQPRVPRPDAVVLAVAVTAAARGHDYGARALALAERRLRREGVRELYARVPRTNGRGLYFMLRRGYAPVAPLEDDGATWFRRRAAADGGATRARGGHARRARRAAERAAPPAGRGTAPAPSAGS